MSDTPTAEPLLIIVHPQSLLTTHGNAGFWTEVPALPACTEVGATAEDAVTRTERQIREWTQAVPADRVWSSRPRQVELAM